MKKRNKFMSPEHRYERAKNVLQLMTRLAERIENSRMLVVEIVSNQAAATFTKADRLLTLSRLVHIDAASLLGAYVNLLAALVSHEVSDGGLVEFEVKAANRLREFTGALTMFDAERVAWARRLARRGIWKKPLPKRHAAALEIERRNRYFERFFALNGDDATPPPCPAKPRSRRGESLRLHWARHRAAKNGVMPS
ncbi:hypothetical protein [Horticoccus sp. 23ND18S-11]|uniref:hypothetical protein n=1 Tax=Horticoccus sp. 23ND18S-11 TaxID=3391832 RepID=UPI0039C9DC0F